MQLCNNIKKYYNSNIYKHIKQHRKMNNTITKVKTTIVFLLRCRSSGLTPNFINNMTKNILNIFKIEDKIPHSIKNNVNNCIEKFHIKILNLLIKHKHNVLKDNEKHLKQNINFLKKHLKAEDNTLLLKSEDNLKKT